MTLTWAWLPAGTGPDPLYHLFEPSIRDQMESACGDGADDPDGQRPAIRDPSGARRCPGCLQAEPGIVRRMLSARRGTEYSHTRST